MIGQIGALIGCLLRPLRIPATTHPAAPESEYRRTIRFLRIAVPASSILLMLPGAWGNSPTIVEFSHLPAGLAVWQRHSFGLYRVCTPVSKLLFALPAHLAGFRVDYPEAFDLDLSRRREWEVGELFQARYLEGYQRIYRWSRLLPILVTIAGGYLVCEWSTRLFGAWPGVVSLCAWCWMPPILAHGSLVTSDVPSAVAVLAAARCFWALLLDPRPLPALLAGITLGLASATKYTLLILYPCWSCLLLLRATRQATGHPLRLAALGCLMFAVSIVTIDALYLFQGVGFRLAGWRTGRSALAAGLQSLGSQGVTAWMLRIPLPLPIEFLRGLDFQLADVAHPQSTYLLGESRLGGWWHWYAIAALIKVPLPAQVLSWLALAGLPAAIRRGERATWAALCTLVPAAEVAMAISLSTGTGMNASFRYMIPALALWCPWIGLAGRARTRPIGMATLGLAAWLGIGSAIGLPDLLGWQNAIARMWSDDRPALLGDNIDWGQDIARLGAWASGGAHGGRTMICVYGLGDTRAYGLSHPRALPASAPRDQCEYVAISENILFGAGTESCAKVNGQIGVLAHELRVWLQRRRPCDRIGSSIRIFRLRSDDARRPIACSPPDGHRSSPGRLDLDPLAEQPRVPRFGALGQAELLLQQVEAQERLVEPVGDRPQRGALGHVAVALAAAPTAALRSSRRRRLPPDRRSRSLPAADWSRYAVLPLRTPGTTRISSSPMSPATRGRRPSGRSVGHTCASRMPNRAQDGTGSAQAPGVSPRTMSNRAASSPILDPLTGANSTGSLWPPFVAMARKWGTS